MEQLVALSVEAIDMRLYKCLIKLRQEIGLVSRKTKPHPCSHGLYVVDVRFDTEPSEYALGELSVAMFHYVEEFTYCKKHNHIMVIYKTEHEGISIHDILSRREALFLVN